MFISLFDAFSPLGATLEAEIPSNVLLNDDGSPILNDDGSYILTTD